MSFYPEIEELKKLPQHCIFDWWFKVWLWLFGKKYRAVCSHYELICYKYRGVLYITKYKSLI